MITTFQDLLENPDIAIVIIRYLTPTEAYALQEVYPVCSFSIDAIYNKALCTYERVKKQFSLYSARPGEGKKPANYAIYHAGGHDYEICTLDRIGDIPKSDIGFLVSIPVPYHDNYIRGFDRHPVTLIRKYVKAICTLDPEYTQDKYTEEEIIAFTRRRVRIIIGLNIKDNHFLLDQKTGWLRQKVWKFARYLNNYLSKLRYPAWVIPTLWGIDNDSGQELYFDSSQVNWLNSRADKLRGHLRQVRVPKSSTSMSFPFASIRSFLIESTVCQTMLDELSTLNTKVYYLTGDADLISLKPINRNTSVFNLVCETINKSPAICYMRLGGAYGFENEDIAQHILSTFKILPELFLAKSVLMTQLLRSLDIATRRIMAQIDAALAYYSEVHTYTTSEVFDQEGKHFKRKGSDRSPDTQNSPITKTARNSKLDEPDITAHVTRTIIQPKNWLTASRDRNQTFIAKRSTQLLTSSRHDLVVIRPASSKMSSTKHVQVIDEVLSTEVLREMIAAQHNTQLTASQLNSRFREAGYGPNGFHESVALLPMIRLPFVIYFLTESNSKNKETKEKNKKRIREAKEETTRHAISSAGVPATATFLAIYQKLIEISETPEILLAKEPDIDITAMRSIGTQRLNTHRKAILKAFFQFEYLLRWAIIMMEKINTLTEAYTINIKRKTVSKDTDFIVFGEHQNPSMDVKPISRSLLPEFSTQPASYHDSAEEDEIPEPIKQESLLFAKQQGKIGPRAITGWTLFDVEDKGNCFYDAVAHQMRLINHEFLLSVPEGTLSRDSLRLRIQGTEFTDREWADAAEMGTLARQLNLVIGIVDTRTPVAGFVYHYINNEGLIDFTRDLSALPIGRQILRLVFTGDHYLSVVETSNEAVRRMINNHLPSTAISFFRRIQEEFVIENRNKNPQLRRAYDERFGLVLR